jgi:hypothetical protein
MQSDRRWVVALAVAAAGAAGWYLLRGSTTPRPTLGPTTPIPSQADSGARIARPSAGEEPALSPTPNAQVSAAAAADAGSPAPEAGAADGRIPPEILEIRAVVLTEPGRAEQLVYRDRERFPGSPFADERDALLVSAIQNQRRPLEARAAARRYFRDHPNGRFKDFVMQATGVRPE